MAHRVRQLGCTACNAQVPCSHDSQTSALAWRLSSQARQLDLRRLARELPHTAPADRPAVARVLPQGSNSSPALQRVVPSCTLPCIPAATPCSSTTAAVTPALKPTLDARHSARQPTNQAVTRVWHLSSNADSRHSFGLGQHHQVQEAPTLYSRVWSAVCAAALLAACQLHAASPALAGVSHELLLTEPMSPQVAPGLDKPAAAAAAAGPASSVQAAVGGRVELLQVAEEQGLGKASEVCSPESVASQIWAGMTNPTGLDSFEGGPTPGGQISYLLTQMGCTSEQVERGMQLLADTMEERRAGAGAGYMSPWGPATRSLGPGLEPENSSSPVLAQQQSRQAPTDPFSPSFTDLSKPMPAWVYAAEAAAAGAAAAAIIALQSRPVGWVARGENGQRLVEVRESPVAGKGLFAAVNIQRGTVLGAYPGRVRTAQEVAAKVETAPMTASYVFAIGDGRYLDPTDAQGNPASWPAPGFLWPFPMDPSLAYANEPPKGARGTNVFVEDGATPEELLFVANRDIASGEEIFIDYGPKYDRSGYQRQ